MEKAPSYPPDQAFLICVALTPAVIGQWKAVYGGKYVGVTRQIPFATTIIDLNCRMEMWVRGPFDFLHFYLSKELLDRIAWENSIGRPFRLREVFFVDDPVVAEITKSILLSIRQGKQLDGLTLEQISTILGAHTLQQYCRSTKLTPLLRCGLQAWQRIRADEMLHSNLGRGITVKQLADACQLSTRHFTRCFRRSFGLPVHRRLLKLRIDHAKGLLLNTNEPLIEIALQSGFCDQAAFNRAFSRIERVTPARWRRFNRVAGSNQEAEGAWENRR